MTEPDHKALAAAKPIPCLASLITLFAGSHSNFTLISYARYQAIQAAFLGSPGTLPGHNTQTDPAALYPNRNLKSFYREDLLDPDRVTKLLLFNAFCVYPGFLECRRRECSAGPSSTIWPLSSSNSVRKIGAKQFIFRQQSEGQGVQIARNRNDSQWPI